MRQDLLALVPAAGTEVISVRNEAFVEGSNFVFENVVVHHASVFKPNTKYTPEWAVVIEVPEAQIASYIQYGFRMKADTKIGTPTIRAKRAVTLKSGEELSPPVVVDADKTPWSESRGLIGNGSVCNVAVRAKYTQDDKGNLAVTCYLTALQVVNHVPYAGSAASAFEVVAGNTSGFVPAPAAQPAPAYPAVAPVAAPATQPLPPAQPLPVAQPAPVAQPTPVVDPATDPLVALAAEAVSALNAAPAQPAPIPQPVAQQPAVSTAVNQVQAASTGVDVPF